MAHNLEVVDVPTLDGYEPLLMSTKDILDIYWGKCQLLLQRAVDEAMHGEMTTDDIYAGIVSGQFFCFILKDDTGEEPNVAVIIILEAVRYPQFTAMNIVIIGGRATDFFNSKFWQHVRSWAYMNGVQKFEALVSPAMERASAKFGFRPMYALVRMDLSED